METKQKVYIALGTTAILASVGFLVYKRNRNINESAALLDYIKTLPKVNTAASLTAHVDNVTANAVAELESVAGQKFDMDGMAIGNIVLKKGNTSNVKQFLAKANEVAKNLHDAMAGANTNENLFYTNLYLIKNKKTLSWMDAYYRVLYKESLFQAIRGEIKLYTGNAQEYIPNFFIPAEITKYSLKLSAYLLSLK